MRSATSSVQPALSSAASSREDTPWRDRSRAVIGSTPRSHMRSACIRCTRCCSLSSPVAFVCATSPRSGPAEELLHGRAAHFTGPAVLAASMKPAGRQYVWNVAMPHTSTASSDDSQCAHVRSYLIAA